MRLVRQNERYLVERKTGRWRGRKRNKGNEKRVRRERERGKDTESNNKKSGKTRMEKEIK